MPWGDKKNKKEGILCLVAHKKKCIAAEQHGPQCFRSGRWFLSEEPSLEEA